MTRRFFSKVAAVTIALAGVPLSSHQRLPEPSASITGHVLEGPTGASPVRRAEVVLSGTALATSRIVITDDKGEYKFEQLPGGRYLVVASKPAYVRAFYGSRRPGYSAGATIAVASGERVQDVTIRMARGAVISGRVTDGRGRVQAGIPISVLEVRTNAGEKSGIPSGLVRTDDLGEFRFFGLRPGTYAVTAMASERGFEGATQTTLEIWQSAQAGNPQATSSRPLRVGFAPVLFPGTTDFDEATLLHLKEAEERGGVNFSITLVRTGQLAGQVVDTHGQLVPQVQLTLTGPVERFGFRQQVRGQVPTLAVPATGGRFSVDALPPGRYTLFARSAGDQRSIAPAVQWGTVEIRMGDRDVTDLTVILRPGASIQGRIEADTQSLPRGKARISLLPVSSSPFALAPSPATETGDGGFTFEGVAPGRYRLAVDGLSSPWTLESARAGHIDLLDTLLEIADQPVMNLVATLTSRPAGIVGLLSDGQGQPVAEYRILAFSTERNAWSAHSSRIRVGRPGSDGHYSLSGIPAGEYYIVGITDDAPDDLADAAFLEGLVPVAIRAAVKRGETTRLDLKVGAR